MINDHDLYMQVLVYHHRKNSLFTLHYIFPVSSLKQTKPFKKELYPPSVHLKYCFQDRGRVKDNVFWYINCQFDLDQTVSTSAIIINEVLLSVLIFDGVRFPLLSLTFPTLNSGTTGGGSKYLKKEEV